MKTNLESVAYFQPEILLVLLILVVVLADLSRKWARLARSAAVIGLLLLIVWTAAANFGFPEAPTAQNVGPRIAHEMGWSAEKPPPGPNLPARGFLIFEGAAAHDRFGLFFRLGFVVATFLVVLVSLPVIRRWPTGQGEFLTLVLACLLGMMLMASARSLLMMYLALEFTSVTSYILAGMLRRNRKSAEASLKYIIYGGAASGVMIFGMGYLYGLTGETDVAAIGAKLLALQNAGQIEPLMALVTSVLLMTGFGYKIAAVPFHMWCPDVYEGAPTPVTAFFSVGPKAAGFAMLARFLAGIFGVRPDAGVDVETGRAVIQPFVGPLPEWTAIIALLAVFTMAIGNFVALHQTNLKRLLAYSSIAHAGYMLLAFTVFTGENLASLTFYVIVYIIMNLGAFFVAIELEERYRIETIDGCAGLGGREPGLCVAMTIFLISLTGLPPTAGFIGKLLIFGYLIKGGMFGISLAFVGVLMSAISLYYYARIFIAMFLHKAPEGGVMEARSGGPIRPVILLLAGLTLLFGLFWSHLYHLAMKAGRGLL